MRLSRNGYQQGASNRAFKFANTSLTGIDIIEKITGKKTTPDIFGITAQQAQSLIKVAKNRNIKISDSLPSTTAVIKAIGEFKCLIEHEYITLQSNNVTEFMLDLPTACKELNVEEIFTYHQKTEAFYILLYMMHLLVTMGYDTRFEELDYIQEFPQACEETEKENHDYEVMLFDKYIDFNNKVSQFMELIANADEWNNESSYDMIMSNSDLSVFVHIVLYLKSKEFHLSKYQEEEEEEWDGPSCFEMFRLNCGMDDELDEYRIPWDREGYRPLIRRKFHFPDGTILDESFDELELAGFLSCFDFKTLKFEIYDADESYIQSIESIIHLHLKRKVRCVYRNIKNNTNGSNGIKTTTKKECTFKFGKIDDKQQNANGGNSEEFNILQRISCKNSAVEKPTPVQRPFISSQSYY
jgi:hypothetical protein